MAGKACSGSSGQRQSSCQCQDLATLLPAHTFAAAGNPDSTLKAAASHRRQDRRAAQGTAEARTLHQNIGHFTGRGAKRQRMSLNFCVKEGWLR